MKTTITGKTFLDAMKTDEKPGVEILNWGKTVKEWDNLISKIYAQGRKDGLKEMDDIHIAMDDNTDWKNRSYELMSILEKLRKEYQS